MGRCGAPKGKKGGIIEAIRREDQGSYAGEGAWTADVYNNLAVTVNNCMALLRWLLQRRCAIEFGRVKLHNR